MRALSLIALYVPALLFGQDGSKGVHVQLDQQSIRIGEQALLTIHADANTSGIVWPVIGDTITRHIEVVKDHGVDTLQASGNNGPRLVRSLTLTAFDTGYWAIPPFRMQVGARTVETDPLLLHVTGMEVPKGARPADIPPIHEANPDPLIWLVDHWTWVTGVLLLGAIAAAIVILLGKRKVKEVVVEAAALPPLHERVLAAFDTLERERLWQHGDHKAYHSRLTDLLRGYIEERYNIPALESTTDELMHELRVSPLTSEQQGLLGNMLRLADMVKFAKALPAPEENEQMITSARRFVFGTAPTIFHEARA
ncbi:MAG: hypothetical protein IPI81_01965 [Flavobacteriales bacterium]|nr:hypothetical protein [Flavobacteriales bacterium]MCC6939888.1 hypothetical protein [Flavobacteriales bacterium]